MKNKLLFIPPFYHFLSIKNFIKDKKVLTKTKISILFENIGLYFLAGLLLGIEGISVYLAILIILISFLLSPIEWKLIEHSKKRKNTNFTNWKSFKKKDEYYFLQFQLSGYIVIGYLVIIGIKIIL